jgi:antitoxin component of MazEF toxin-antitoxin module
LLIRKLFRTGRTLAVGVPQALAEAAALHEGDYVLWEHDAATGALLLWPAARRARLGLRSEYLREVAAFLDAYGPALAALQQAASAAPAPSAPPGAPGARPAWNG